VSKVTVEDAAERLIRHTMAVPDVTGLTWWASHDIHPRHTGFNPLEYDLGLLDINNQRKPVADRFTATITTLRRTPLATTPPQLTLPPGITPDLAVAARWSQTWRPGIDLRPNR
jgi:hypothetical protein